MTKKGREAEGLRSRDHKPEKSVWPWQSGDSAYKPDPENSRLCWHCTIACNGLRKDPGCEGKGVKPLPKNAPKLWSDRLRQWTKSEVVSSLKLKATGVNSDCSAYIAESGAKFGIFQSSMHSNKRCCRICNCMYVMQLKIIWLSGFLLSLC
jgi:hypothetical protein